MIVAPSAGLKGFSKTSVQFRLLHHLPLAWIFKLMTGIRDLTLRMELRTFFFRNLFLTMAVIIRNGIENCCLFCKGFLQNPLRNPNQALLDLGLDSRCNKEQSSLCTQRIFDSLL